MGLEVDCVARHKGKTLTGRAHLEPKELVFRSDIRVKIPIGSDTRASLTGAWLRVTSGGDEIELKLGAAEGRKWAERLLHPKSRIDKLGVKAGARVLLVEIGDDDLRRELKKTGAVVATTADAGEAAVVFVRARRAAELKTLPRLERLIARDGAIWVVFQKGADAIRQADVMAAAKAAGLVTVKVVAFSDEESALKLVIPVARR